MQGPFMRASWQKLTVFWAICALSFLAVTVHFRPYFFAVMHFGDSVSYVSVARAIATWNFTGLHVFQFWGVSYAVALVSLAGRLSYPHSFVIVCAGSSLAVTLLSGRLWGWTVAALFTALSFEWMQRSLLGGSEPFFMLLLLIAFWCVRREQWQWAALFAALATTVRPLGICALVAIGLVLLIRKDHRRFAFALGIGAMIGVLYVLPLHFYLHDSLATVHSYETSRHLFGIPFYAIVQGTLYYHVPLTNLVLSYFWIVLIMGGLGLFAFSESCAEYRREHPVELIFALLYTFAICCYNYPEWALGNFARFAIPTIPFALIGWRQFAPKVETLAWVSAVVFPALAACSAYGIRNIVKF